MITRNTGIIAVLLFCLSIPILAQKRATAQVPISVSIREGTNIKKLNDNLEFFTSQKSTIKSTLTKNPSEGVILEIAGISKRNIIIDYNSIKLKNINTSQYSNSPNELIHFEPNIFLSELTAFNQTESDYTLNFKRKNKYDKLILSVGGNLVLPDNQSDGHYLGDFTLTLTY
jgi:hypothetical protein